MKMTTLGNASLGRRHKTQFLQKEISMSIIDDEGTSNSSGNHHSKTSGRCVCPGVAF
ncbi:MAG: hypothetical protein OJF50_004946 [Nitrospira sp.]|nr:hypothetical protein [Nitrospira sp.]